MFGHDDKDKEDKAELGNTASNDNKAGGQDWQHPGTPIDDNSIDDKKDAAAPVISPSEDKAEPEDDRPEEPKAPLDISSKPSAPEAGSTDDLIDLKQEALNKLSPLIGHLDQSPEEKFRTLMMMIQASDDQSMIKQAYDAALDISDEKERAQALLDIVNEINYFTQNSAKPE